MSKNDKSGESLPDLVGRGNNKVRLIDIAKRANVSISSVSRVLSGVPNIDVNIRQKIEQAMADMNIDKSYFVKKNNETYKFKSIVLLMGESSDSQYYTSLFKGIKDVAFMHHYEIIIANMSEYIQDIQKMEQLIQENNVHGIIHLPTESSYTFVQSILDKKIPLVLMDDFTNYEQAYSVSCDNHSGAVNAVRYLISLGHKRILYLAGNSNQKSERTRFSGYCDALEKAGLSIEKELKAEGLIDYKSIHDALSDKINNSIEFTAVFCENDLMAFATKKALEEHGLSIPEKVSIMSFEDSALSSAMSLTTCSRPAYAVGRNAMLMLLDIINGFSIPEKHIVLQPTIKIRTSCKRNYKNFEDSARKITSGRTIRIGFTPPATSEFYDIIKHGANTMMRELSERFNVNFEFEVAAAMEHKAVKAQMDIIEDWAAKKFDAILVCSYGDIERMNPVFEKAENAGTAIYLFNMPFEMWKETELKVTSVISYNNRSQAGFLVGRYAAEKLNGNGNILMIRGLPGHWSTARKEGFMDAIESYSGIKIIGEGWGEYTHEGGMRAAMEFLSKNPDVDLIYGENEEMAQGAVQAIEKLGLKFWDGKEGIITIGADGLKSGYESIKNGKLTATVDVGPVDQGREFIMAVFMHEALGYNVDKIINVNTMVVDINNVDISAGHTDWALGTEYPEITSVY